MDFRILAFVLFPADLQDAQPSPAGKASSHILQVEAAPLQRRCAALKDGFMNKFHLLSFYITYSASTSL
jgi:hypothetical protein